MITIDICIGCSNKYKTPFGECPIHKKIQDGLEIIDQAMLKGISNKAIRSDGIPLSVAVSGHWITECKFECEHFTNFKGEMK